MTLLRSFSFRLAILYGLLFTASVGVLGGIYYWVAIRGPIEATENRLVAEARALRRAHARVGSEGLVAILERRAGAPSPRLAYHALLGRDGRALTSNLPSWPTRQSGRWLRIEADVSREGAEDEYEALVLDETLPDGTRLLLGRDIEDLEELEEGLANTAAWLLPALVLLSLFGGFVMSRAIGRRIERVSSAARQVIEGDLSRRIAISGAGDDFDHLSSTLNTMLDRLEASLHAVQRVSDTVAHELRTPVSRLRAELDELAATTDPDRLAGAIAETARLTTIFDAVLRISRIEARRHAGRRDAVDLGALLGEVAEYHEPAAADLGISLQTAIAPGLLVRGDPDLLFQAFSNLLDNALKYAPGGSLVRIEAAAEAGGFILVEVADNGPGVPADLRGKLTERFFRGDAGADAPGFGLGLAFVAAVAAHHRSRLDFADAAPGLRVVWRFPADGAR